jgi:hypothetical protein
MVTGAVARAVFGAAAQHKRSAGEDAFFSLLLLSMIFGLIRVIAMKGDYGGDGQGNPQDAFGAWFGGCVMCFVVVGALAAVVYILIIQ